MHLADEFLAEQVVRNRMHELRRIFTDDTSGPSSSSSNALIASSTPLAVVPHVAGVPSVLDAALSVCYTRAIEMASVVVVLYPIISQRAPDLSEERQMDIAEHYGMLIWKSWTLVAAVRPTETADAEMKFRNFSLGILYHAQRLFEVKFDLAAILERMTTAAARALVSNAMREMLHAAATLSDAEVVAEFASRFAIKFFRADPYLQKRLVPENKLGIRNTRFVFSPPKPQPVGR
jgi:hypothetical protein